MRLLLLVCATTLLGTAADCGAAPSSEPRPEAAHLSFGWQPGMTADVAAITRTTMKLTGSPKEGDGFDKSVSTDYQLRTEQSGKDMLVSFNVSRINGSPVTPDMANGLRGLFPSFTVTTDGDFSDVDVGSATALRDEIRKLDTPETKVVMPGLSPDPMARATAVAVWNNLVGIWRHIDVSPGEEIARTRHSDGALLGQVQSATLTYRLNGEAPCSRSGATRRCVEMALSSNLGASQFESMIARMTAMARQTDPSFSMEFDDARMTMTAIIEPDGMIPHHSLRTTTITMHGTENGQPVHGEMVKTDEASIDFK